MLSKIMDCKDASDCLQAIIMFMIILLINIIVVRFLWNTALVKHITVLRPATTLLDTLLLSIALSLFTVR